MSSNALLAMGSGYYSSDNEQHQTHPHLANAPSIDMPYFPNTPLLLSPAQSSAHPSHFVIIESRDKAAFRIRVTPNRTTVHTLKRKIKHKIKIRTRYQRLYHGFTQLEDDQMVINDHLNLEELGLMTSTNSRTAMLPHTIMAGCCIRLIVTETHTFDDYTKSILHCIHRVFPALMLPYQVGTEIAMMLYGESSSWTIPIQVTLPPSCIFATKQKNIFIEDEPQNVGDSTRDRTGTKSSSPTPEQEMNGTIASAPPGIRQKQPSPDTDQEPGLSPRGQLFSLVEQAQSETENKNEDADLIEGALIDFDDENNSPTKKIKATFPDDNDNSNTTSEESTVAEPTKLDMYNILKGGSNVLTQSNVIELDDEDDTIEIDIDDDDDLGIESEIPRGFTPKSTKTELNTALKCLRVFPYHTFLDIIAQLWSVAEPLLEPDDVFCAKWKQTRHDCVCWHDLNCVMYASYQCEKEFITKRSEVDVFGSLMDSVKDICPWVKNYMQYKYLSRDQYSTQFNFAFDFQRYQSNYQQYLRSMRRAHVHRAFCVDTPFDSMMVKVEDIKGDIHSVVASKRFSTVAEILAGANEKMTAENKEELDSNGEVSVLINPETGDQFELETPVMQTSIKDGDMLYTTVTTFPELRLLMGCDEAEESESESDSDDDGWS